MVFGWLRLNVLLLDIKPAANLDSDDGESLTVVPEVLALRISPKDSLVTERTIRFVLRIIPVDTLARDATAYSRLANPEGFFA
jgi:hypothetical protein